MSIVLKILAALEILRHMHNVSLSQLPSPSLLLIGWSKVLFTRVHISKENLESVNVLLVVHWLVFDFYNFNSFDIRSYKYGIVLVQKMVKREPMRMLQRIILSTPLCMLAILLRRWGFLTIITYVCDVFVFWRIGYIDTFCWAFWSLLWGQRRVSKSCN